MESKNFDQFVADVRASYRRAARGYEASWTAPHAYLQHERELFLSHVRAGSHVLDIGCNAGVDSCWLDTAGMRVVGVDFSEPSLALARTKSSQIDFRLGDIRELSAVAPERFDAFWASLVFLHLPPEKVSFALAQAADRLRSGSSVGLIVMAVEDSPVVEETSFEIPADDGTPVCFPIVRWRMSDLTTELERWFTIREARRFIAVRNRGAASFLVSRRYP